MLRFEHKDMGAICTDHGMLLTRGLFRTELLRCEQNDVSALGCSQARRTLSGLLRKGKEALRENDAGEAVLAARQVCAHELDVKVSHCCVWCAEYKRSSGHFKSSHAGKMDLMWRLSAGTEDCS